MEQKGIRSHPAAATWTDEPPTLLIICHLTVYQSQSIWPCLCEQWIFLFYWVINFSWIISCRDPCCDKCRLWIMHTFIVLPPHRRQPTPSDALHDKQKAPHHITQMCLWGCPSLHYRGKRSVTTASGWHTMRPSTSFSLRLSERLRETTLM